MSRPAPILALIVVLVLGFVAWQWRYSPFWSRLWGNDHAAIATSTPVVEDPGGLPQVYTNKDPEFSIRYPEGYTPDPAYVYQALGPGREISGVKFTISPTLAQGTNLSRDSYISVERIATSTCSAALFLDNVVPRNLTDGIVTYSFATTSGAGAGNLYEEQVFALPKKGCTAVRYYIHSGNIGNYEPGAVREFDRRALLSQFDAIRKTLVIIE